ncbi:hypothetical protein NMG60_11025963 [Bertholletia excelsa]
MRSLRLEAESDFHVTGSPPATREPTTTQPDRCTARNCPWRPYTDSRDFASNATIIVVVLFCALLCGLALNAAVRCGLRCRRRRLHQQEVEAEPKPAACAAEDTAVKPPTVVYSAGVGLAGATAECAICLTEFTEGEGIRVLEGCKHGFHVQCIEGWLRSRSSCPTCRASCPPAAAAASASVGEGPRQ